MAVDYPSGVADVTPTFLVGGNSGTSQPSQAAISASGVTLIAAASAAAREPAHTGDVTNSAGSLALAIATGAVTDTKASLATKPACMVVATSNLTLSGEQTIDGQLTAGSLVLASAQTAGAEKGPWVSGAGAWTRPTWYPAGGTTQAFQFITIFIRLGTTYGGSTWRITSAGAVTIDTTATTWAVTTHALNANTVTGALPAAQMPALTGAVTSSAGAVATTLSTNLSRHTFGVTLDGGGSVLATGQKGYVTVPFAGTITGWNITADAGTCTLDIWKIATGTAIPTVSNTITASAKPALATGTAIHSTTLTAWTTSVVANDIIGFNLDAVATATKITLVVEVVAST